MANQTEAILGPLPTLADSVSKPAVLTPQEFAARYLEPWLAYIREWHDFEEERRGVRVPLKPAAETSILRAPDARPDPVEDSYTP